MKKINNKGFMMVEVVVASSVILTTLVSLYATFNKMYSVYYQRSYYYDVDNVYILRNIYTYLIEFNKMNDLVNAVDSSASGYLDIYNTSYLGSDDYMGTSFVKTSDNDGTAGDILGLNKIYLVKYNADSINKLVEDKEKEKDDKKRISDGLKDYLLYLTTYLDYTEDFSYIFVCESKDGNYYYYGNYRIG